MAKHSGHVLLLGGHGFIGRALSTALFAKGYSVRVLDPSPAPPNFKGESLAGDYRQRSVLKSAIAGCHAVFHMVHTRVHRNIDADLASDLQENLEPLPQLLDVCVEEGIRRFVYLSSGGTVYGEARSPLQNESHPTLPLSPYGLLKLSAENYVRLFGLHRGLDYLIARPANAYGPGQRPFAGQGVVATALSAGILGKPLKLFTGASYTRDYVHVNDVADALVALLEKGQAREIYNIGSGVGVSLRNLVNEHLQPLLQAQRIVLPVDESPSRGVDVNSNVLDVQKIAAHTGWQPRVSLEQGLRETLAWLLDQHQQGLLARS